MYPVRSLAESNSVNRDLGEATSSGMYNPAKPYKNKTIDLIRKTYFRTDG